MYRAVCELVIMMSKKFTTKGSVCDKIAVEWSNKAASTCLKTAFVYNFEVNVLAHCITAKMKRKLKRDSYKNL